MNMDVMEKHLSLTLQKVPKGRHAVIVVDGAAWHQVHLTERFDNLSIIKLPPYSPELNPIEQVWHCLNFYCWLAITATLSLLNWWAFNSSIRAVNATISF
jgi:transposase